MEYGLVHLIRKSRSVIYHLVLILVLMEDGLVPYTGEVEVDGKKGLNPCFNGRWSRTYYSHSRESKARGVLILVLMEDGLVHECRNNDHRQ